MLLLLLACGSSKPPSAATGPDDSAGCAAPLTRYADADGDGFGDPDAPVVACADGGATDPGVVDDATDCDDADAARSPTAVETCDAVDQDCDGTVDEEATDALSWRTDSDDDGYGDPGSLVLACEAPSGTVADGSDCDDSRLEAHPGATELCNGLDDTCDGTVDEGLPVAGWYDLDGDGYGDPDRPVEGCEVVPGVVADPSDCADDDADVHPGAVEVCGNGLDDDCDPAFEAACALSGDLFPGSATTRLFGDVEVSLAGGRVADAGDVDGDGRDDLILGAAGTAPGGAVYVVTGSPVGDYSLGSAARLTHSSGGAGFAVSGAGDVDGDGFDDVWVTADADSTYVYLGGVAYLVPGPITGPADIATVAISRLWGETEQGYAGWDIAPAGDVNGDGREDVIIGEAALAAGYISRGHAYVFCAPPLEAALGTADAHIQGSLGNERMGVTVDGAGDIDGDGTDDVVVGTYGTGEVFAYYGPVMGTLLDTDCDVCVAAHAGYDASTVQEVQGLGDVDGDGRDDFAAVAASSDNATFFVAEEVYIYTAAPASLDDAAITLTAPYTSSGLRFTDVPDMDGDGRAEVAISSPGDSDTALYAGVVWLVRAPPSGVSAVADVATFTFHGDATGLTAGSDIASMFYDEDDVPDLLVGGMGLDFGGLDDVGGGWVISGGGL